MTPSNEYLQIAAAFPKDFNLPADDVSTVRAKMKPWHGHPLQPDTRVVFTDFEGVALGWLTASDVLSSERYALFCHGGGFVSCTMESYLFFAENISSLLDCSVVTPDYRLAPEHRYPAAVQDCLAGYRALLQSGIAPEQIFTIGDSCGGGLAAALLLLAQEAGLPMPACHVGFSGWYDLDLPAEIQDSYERAEPMITPGWFRNRVRDYLGPADPRAPSASPAYAAGVSLPPLLLQAGENDLCLAGAQQFASAARQAGGQAQVQVFEGMPHGFHGLISSGVPESEQAWNAAGEFIDCHVPASEF